MELPQINLKYLAVAAAIIVAVVLLVLFNPFQTRTINAYFDPTGVIKPGQTTALVVEVTNTLGKDIASESISVGAVDPASLTIGTMPAPQSNVARGDIRRFRINVTAGDVVDGTYSLSIKVNFGEKEENTRIALEVRK